MYLHDVFIAYTATDREFAHLLFLMFEQQELSAFMVCLTNNIGEGGAALVGANLPASRWALLLVGAQACQHLKMWHKHGVEYLSGTKVIPVVWGIQEFALPAWVDRENVLNLDSVTADQVGQRIAETADRIEGDRGGAAIVLGTVLSAHIGRAIGRGARLC